DQVVPVGQEPFQSVAFERRPAGAGAVRGGEVRVREVAAGGGGQLLGAGGDDARAGRHRLDDLGGGQGDDGHAQVHGLQQGEAERGPAHRVQVAAAGGHRAVQLGLRQVGAAAAVGGEAERLGQALGAHAEDVERGRPGEQRQQVGAGGTAAPQRLVDDDGGARQLTGPAVAGIGDAVVDDGGPGGAAVPEQPVERGDVDEQQVAAVGDRVPGVGDVAVRRVVLQVDGGYVAAGAAAGPPLGQRLLVRALEHHQVDLGLAELLGRELDDA